MKLAICLSLMLMPIGGIAQTATILNLSVAQEPHPGARSIGVELSIFNDKKVPTVLNNRFFYLSDHDKGVYLSLSRRNNSDVSFNVQSNPGNTLTEQLWFEVPEAIDVHTLTLCLHAPENKSWDDYLEIPFALPVPATAPMWHPFHPGDPMDPMAYGGTPNLTPPKLRSAPEPKLPPGGPELLKEARGKVFSVVSLIVDRQGNPQQVQVVTAAGLGFDAEAIKAVRKYRFKPALDRDGNPFAVKVLVTVIFHLY